MRYTLLHTTAIVLQAVVQAGGIVVESLPTVPPGWAKVSNADPVQIINLRVALSQPNENLLEQTLYDVSNPEHPLYGRHLGREEVASMMKPRDASTAAVLNWLSESGIPNLRVEDEGEWISFRITVDDAESLLDTSFAVYTYLDTGIKKIRALKYSIPEEVATHITMIAPIVRFGHIKSQWNSVFKVVNAPPRGVAARAANVPTLDLNVSECNVSITPECLRALYKIGDYQADPSGTSLLGVAGFQHQYAQYDQLAIFNEKYAPYAAGTNFTVVSVNGGGNDQNDPLHYAVEANLDMQHAEAMSYRTRIAFYSTGGTGPGVPSIDQPDPTVSYNEPYLEFLTYMLQQPNSKLPQTLSVSYGEPEQMVPTPYAKKVCQMFGQLGVRGVSVIFASGDGGPGSGCLSNDGKNTTRFTPYFPAACPYVTSVGSTWHIEPEAAANFSSGGFSDIFPRPLYQEVAVLGYLARLGRRWHGLYNPAGRGFPDVATQGDMLHVFEKGEDILVSGTSASTPVFAGIVSLLNSNRMRAGLPPMGFLNPWLYTVGWLGFTDIVHGGSQGCTGTSEYSGLPGSFSLPASVRGLLFIGPVMAGSIPANQVEFAMRTYDRRAATYENSWHRGYTPRFIELVPLRQGDKVLSLCCGTGLDAFAAADAVGPEGRVVGVDISEAMLDVARARRTAEDYRAIQFVRHDVTDLGSVVGDSVALVQPGEFDAILCSNALHLLDNPTAVVRHWSEYLRPGGILAVDIPHERNAPAGLSMERAVRRTGREYTYGRSWIRSRESLREILEGEGFKVEKVAEMDKDPGQRPAYFTVDQADGQFDYIVKSDRKASSMTEEVKEEVRPAFREEFAKIAVDGKVELVESLYIYIARKRA